MLLLALWIGACTHVGHIQREDPVRQSEGITHYAITLGMTAETDAFAELRVVRSARGPGLPAGSRAPSPHNVINEYWKTVKDCAAQAEAAGGQPQREVK